MERGAGASPEPDSDLTQVEGTVVAAMEVTSSNRWVELHVHEGVGLGGEEEEEGGEGQGERGAHVGGGIQEEVKTVEETFAVLLSQLGGQRQGLARCCAGHDGGCWGEPVPGDSVAHSLRHLRCGNH